jgi:hypothetical protein
MASTVPCSVLAGELDCPLIARYEYHQADATTSFESIQFLVANCSSARDG